jgi:outer membrane protein OmpA-like peptidoglycan-associated protein
VARRLLPDALMRRAVIALLVLGALAPRADETPESYSVIGKVTVEVEAPAPQKDPPRAQLADGQVRPLERIYFVSGEPAAKLESRAALDAVAEVMIAARHVRLFRVEAHTDNVVSDNLGLAQRRADWVRAYLIKKGVSPERLQSVPYGSSRPLAPNDTPAGRQLNRRVEFVVAE